MAASSCVPMRLYLEFGSQIYVAIYDHYRNRYLTKYITVEEMASHLVSGCEFKESYGYSTRIPYLTYKYLSSDLLKALKNVSSSLISLQMEVSSRVADDPFKRNQILELIIALRDKMTIVEAEIKGFLPNSIFGSLNAMLETLPLKSLILHNYSHGVDGLELIPNIRTLKRLIVSLRHVPTKQLIALLFSQSSTDSCLADQLEILEIDHGKTEDNQLMLKALSDNLATNTTLKILRINAHDVDLSPLGEALRINTELQSLEIDIINSESNFFSGLNDNKSLIQLIIKQHKSPDPEAFIGDLIEMLKRNTYLEILNLYLHVIPVNLVNHLFKALAHSSIVDLNLSFANLTNVTEFITFFLEELETNKNMKKLTISDNTSDHYEEFDVPNENSIDSSVLVHLLTHNTTLEVLKIYGIDNFENPDLLQGLEYNSTLIRVSDNMPDTLKMIAQRNKFNKNKRETSLLKLTM